MRHYAAECQSRSAPSHFFYSHSFRNFSHSFQFATYVRLLSQYVRIIQQKGNIYHEEQRNSHPFI